MKRGLIFGVLALFLFSIISINLASADLEISKYAVNKIVVRELSLPAIYDLNITNKGAGDYFTIDTLLNIMIYPKGPYSIGGGETKTIQIGIFPKASERNRYYGDWSFKYFIKGQSSAPQEDNIIIKIVSLKDILSLEAPTSVKSTDQSIVLKIKNAENISLDGQLNVDSTLFSYAENITLSPVSSQEVTIPLEAEKLSKEAGTYNLKVSLIVNNEAEVSFIRDMILESNVLITTNSSVESSTFIEKLITTKTNDGNTPTDVKITAKRNFLQSLLTTSNVPADSVTREGSDYIYQWNRKLNPNDSFTAQLTTNYAWPWIILIIIIICYLIVSALTRKQIYVRKKALRIRTKGGQFAVKIVLFVKNKGKECSHLKIIESIPPFTELLADKFGTIKPAEIKKHSVIWDIPYVAKKEEFILSYIVYSKVSVIGRLEVSPAIATYQTASGMMKESKSNSIFILTEEQQPAKVELVK